jgi:23S rRNA (pseudouridine1915-N3)-methyltransferase
MKLNIIAVGQKMPAWVEMAWADYYKRFPAEFKPVLKTVKAETRGSKTTVQLMAAERTRIEASIPPDCRVIVLDERGQHLTTKALADKVQSWQGDGRDCAWLIGGPDGLDPALKARADEAVRLSDLTLPHAMVRVLLIEQLYRAWSIITHHPYHRE